MADSISKLFQAVQASRHDDPSASRTARLLRSGRGKMAKMDRRERLLGIAEKMPKKVLDEGGRRQIIALESRRARKRR
jgi:hypothetical protein